jgi:hypothetical protein
MIKDFQLQHLEKFGAIGDPIYGWWQQPEFSVLVICSLRTIWVYGKVKIDTNQMKLESF